MRQRYYDTEIKRFLNQDILTGSIGDSQSLNRYSYVQGNPVSFSDPFGLSPFERLRQAFRPLHAVLNIAGIIPGPVGMLASLAQAGLYGLEGNSALAAHYLSQSLMIGLAGPVGGAVLGDLSKMGPAAKVILGTVLGAQSLYTAGVAGINLYNSASTIADGLLNGDMSWLDAFCEGSMALNSAAGIYYSLKGLVNSCELTLKGLDDVAAKYAAKQEAWYKEHAGAVQDGCSIATGSYTDRQTGQIVEAGACFIAGTKIQTLDGEVNIEDIQAGDQVYARNVDTGEVGVKEVKQTFVREVNTLVHVFVGDEEIITTTNHPFYVVGRGFVKAEDLRIGYTLLQLDGSTEKISRIVVENLGAPVKVYNFEVEDWHTYYVADKGVLVHNVTQLCKKNGNEDVLWTNHGYKHFPNKNQSWNQIVKSTKSGSAKYSFDIQDVEAFERSAWESGTPVTNGKNWRVNKYDKVIGAVDGKETVYVRIEKSANTIHGHPISKAEYNKLMKKN